MSNTDIIFRNPADMATFLAEVVRQGLTYEIENGHDSGTPFWVIRLTGGY